MLAQIHTNRTSHTAADREAAPGGLRRLLELYRLTFLYINSGGNQDRTARFKVSSPAPFLCPEKKFNFLVAYDTFISIYVNRFK
jgi:hypothetical protein